MMNTLPNFDGQAVALLAAIAGFTPKPEDYQVLNDVFARNPDGTLVSPQYRLTCERDDLARVLTCCALGWLYLAGEQRILWTTHGATHATMMFRQLVETIDSSSELRSRVARIKSTNGDQEIRLTAGPRLLMRTRRMSTRGFAVSRLIIDQADMLTTRQVHELMPVIASRPNSQVFYGYES